MAYYLAMKRMDGVWETVARYNSLNVALDRLEYLYPRWGEKVIINMVDES